MLVHIKFNFHGITFNHLGYKFLYSVVFVYYIQLYGLAQSSLNYFSQVSFDKIYFKCADQFMSNYKGGEYSCKFIYNRFHNKSLFHVYN